MKNVRVNRQCCGPVIHVPGHIQQAVESDLNVLQPRTTGSSVANLAFYNTPPATPALTSFALFDPPAHDSGAGRMSGMEGDDQQRRQAEQSHYPQSYAEHAQILGSTASSIRNVRGLPAGTPADRVSHAQYLPGHPSTTAPSVPSSAITQDIGGYGYPHGQQFQPQQTPGGAFSYQAGYQQHPQRAQQNPQYPHQAMYALPQQPQLQHQSPFNTLPPYQQRQTTAVEVLSTQFGGQQYYNNGEVPTASASISYQTPAFQQTAHYSLPEDLGRSTLTSGYPVVDPHFSQASASEPTGQQQQQRQQRQQRQQGQSITTADAAYQQLLRQTNTLITQSRLIEARQSLLQLSAWLLNNIEPLGLHRDTPDDRVRYRERLKFWQNFHLCWLAFLQRQFEDTQMMHAARGVLPSGSSLLTMDLLEQLGDEVVRLSDGLQKHGLVDYEMGFGEEEVIKMVEKCIDALSDGADDVDVAQAEAGATAMP
ncbi:MAG: hypothetical protein Q9217_006125 [Psora testacea]